MKLVFNLQFRFYEFFNIILHLSAAAIYRWQDPGYCMYFQTTFSLMETISTTRIKAINFEQLSRDSFVELTFQVSISITEVLKRINNFYIAALADSVCKYNFHNRFFLLIE